MAGAESTIDLEGMKHQDPEPEAPSPTPDEHAPAPGLAVLHAALDRVVTALELQALTVVIDDPDLGRQAFRAGPGPFAPGLLSGGPGCRSIPALPPHRLDADLLVELCAASLHVEVLGAEGMPPTGRDAAELALRRLPGVRAVVVEDDDDLLVVQVFTDADADPELPRTASRVAATLRDHHVVVEILRDAPPVELTPEPEHGPPSEEPTVRDGERTEDAPIRPSTTAPATTVVPTLVAVRSDSEAGEIEVHMRGGETRTIGRAAATDGLAGAATATLQALRGLGDDDLLLSWVRTIETTADRRFVVAVALARGRSHMPRHGLGSGVDSLEAAARATLDAALRLDDTASDG